MRKQLLFALVAFIGCASVAALPSPKPSSPYSYCRDNGGVLEGRTTPSGEGYVVCSFGEGSYCGGGACWRHSECDAWSFYEGTCAKWSCYHWVVDIDSSGNVQSFCQKRDSLD